MSTPPGVRSGWDLVRRGPFARLFWGGFTTSVGDWAALFAQITLADRIAGAPGILTVLAARLLPGLLGSAIGGILADRAGRRLAILLADIGRGGVVLLLVFADSLTELFVISVFLELLTLLGQPARTAVLPRLVGQENLLRANSLTLAAAYGTFPLGAAVAWVMGLIPAITVFGLLPETAELNIFLFDAVTFIASGLLVATIDLGDREAKIVLKADGDGKQRFNLRRSLKDLSDGVVFVARHPRVRPVVIGISVALFGGGMPIVLGRGFALNVLNADEAGFFALLTALGTGAGIGMILLSIHGHRFLHRDVAFALSLLIAGLGLGSTALVKTVAGAMGWMLVMGFGAGAGYVTGFTHLHEHVEDELRGRTFAALFSLMRMSILISMGATAPIAEVLEGRLPAPLDNATRDVLFVGGLIIVLTGMAVLWSLRHLFHVPKMGAEGMRPLDAASQAFGRFRFFRRDDDETGLGLGDPERPTMGEE